jgi:hypothetical protein
VFIIVASRRKKKVGNDLNKEDPRCTWSQEYEVKVQWEKKRKKPFKKT